MSWIEIIDASGRPVARRAAVAVPCTIGSALDNTLVVDAPGVSPYHARIDAEQDGGLTVTALGLAPGLQRPGAPERLVALALTRSAPVAIGGAVIRIVGDPDDAVHVALAATGTPATGWRALSSRGPVQWAAVASLALAGAAVGYFGMPGKDRALNAAVLAVGIAGAEAIWAGFWAIVGRLRHGRARFGQHFVVGTGMTALGWAVGQAESWQTFLVPGAKVASAALLAATACVWGLAVFVHLRVMNQGNGQKHRRIALFVGIASVALLLASKQGFKTGWNSDLEFASVLKPWPPGWVPAKSPNGYAKSLETLERELNEDAVKEAAARDEVKSESTADSAK